jgi:hypothetical protein
MHTEDVRKYNYIYSRPHQLHHLSCCTGSTPTVLCAATTHLTAALALLRVRRTPSRHRLSTVSALQQLCRAPRLLVSRPRRLYLNYVARPGASARRAAHATRRATLRRLLRLRRASGCLVTLRGSSRGSSSTTSPTPHVRLLRHVAWLVARLVVDYFAYASRPGASTRRAARHAARRRPLRLRRAFGFPGTSRGSSRDSSRDSSSTTSPPAVSSSTTSPRTGSSSTRLAQTRRRLLRFAQTCRRLLRLRRASGCLDTSRGSSRDLSRRSSWTTSPTPRVRVPRHVAWLISPLVVGYFTYAARPGASARRVAHLAARRGLLRLRRASGCLGTSRGLSCDSSSTTPCAVTSSCGHTGSTSATPCVATTCLAATPALLRVRRALP